ncbi:deoxycytidine triphosphate deaminase [Mucilaginibacter mallensis]|uniref:Deoxycytidine triphosphate deaminase n=1 Tax=Mucilaginibacter mallensis TaxID=652787 RepID=A0A1H2AVJ2_MUCMA|nr:hypothetical protein [Mucilaginibacter mallensis]SDT49797.1 deoxycytidine triphosphate deaminase [Mucilaginibacter mallensis]
MTTLFDGDPKTNSSILSDKEITDYINRELLITKDSFATSSLEASSYDLRVGKKGIIGGDGIELNLEEKPMEIPPGSYAGIVSFENMAFPKNICARLGSKRTLSYEGIILLTGSIVDPGYKGHLLFGLYNASPKKVIIRYGRKICNIVFEKLGVEPEKDVQPEPNLLNGNLPDQFIDKMANMEVLPWMQISDRVKQIENITKDIIDLKARYEDVLKPIKDLTNNVVQLTSSVTAISVQTKSLAEDLEKANQLVNENSKQINQLTQNLTITSTQFNSTISNISSLSKDLKDQEDHLKDLTIGFKSQSVWNKILGGIVLIVIGALISWLVSKALK